MLSYNFIQRANPRDLSQRKKWFIKPVYRGRRTIAELSADIAMASSLSRGDIMNVLLSMSDQVPRYLLNGQSVQLGEIGTLRVSFSSEGRDEKEELNASLIDEVKFVFTPSASLKALLAEAKFKREEP